MCLVSKTKHLEKAPCDIIAYKILKREDNGFYVTPFTRTPIPTLEINGAAPFKAIGAVSSFYMPLYKVFCIDMGVIHTFTNLKTAILEKAIAFGSLEGYEIFRCVIPKGTHYIKGYDNEYGAKEIVFKKKVSKFWLSVCKIFV